MSGIEELIAVAISAPSERREAALRVLQGNLPKPEPFLTLIDLGRRLGFSTRTLFRWRIPSHDLGTCKRYRLSEVEAYLKSETFLRRQAALRAERRGERALARFQFGDGLIRPPGRQLIRMAGSKSADDPNRKGQRYGSSTTTNQSQ